MRAAFVGVLIGCGGPSSGAPGGALTLSAGDGQVEQIQVGGDALSFDCARCDALYVVLTDEPDNFDCDWVRANYGSEPTRVPSRPGTPWNLFWDERYPNALHAVQSRDGVFGLGGSAAVHTLEAEMTWDVEGLQGQLEVEGGQQLEFEAFHCGVVE